jgi:predicted MFS family arabinose efflux permease
MPSKRLYTNPAFVVFWSARTISCAGTGITMVVLPVLVYKLTGSATAVAALTVLQSCPYVVFGLVAGALADRVNRKKMMVAWNGVAAMLLASIPVTAALHLLAIPQVFVVSFGIGTAYVWFDAANFGSVPALVDRTQLPAAMSLIASSGTLAMLIGPAIGGLLLTVMSPPYALGFDAASYVISALLLASIRRPFRKPQHTREQLARIRSDIAEGLRYLWHQPVIRTLTLSVFCACLSWGGVFALLVVYASRALHLAHADVRLGLLYSAGELGGLISVVAVPAVVKRRAIGQVVAAFLAANAAAIALLAIAPSYGWALVLFCAYELAYLMVASVGVTVRQMLSPDHMQARINTAGRLIASSGQPIGALLGGLLAEVLPIRLTFALLALGVAIGAGLAGWACLGSRPLASISISAPPTVP